MRRKVAFSQCKWKSQSLSGGRGGDGTEAKGTQGANVCELTMSWEPPVAQRAGQEDEMCSANGGR